MNPNDGCLFNLQWLAKGFLKATPERKRELAGIVLSNIQVGSLKVQDYQFKMPYDVIAKGPKPTTFSEMLAQWDVIGTFLISD